MWVLSPRWSGTTWCSQLGTASSPLAACNHHITSANSLPPSHCRTTQHSQFAMGKTCRRPGASPFSHPCKLFCDSTSSAVQHQQCWVGRAANRQQQPGVCPFNTPATATEWPKQHCHLTARSNGSGVCKKGTHPAAVSTSLLHTQPTIVAAKQPGAQCGYSRRECENGKPLAAVVSTWQQWVGRNDLALVSWKQ